MKKFYFLLLFSLCYSNIANTQTIEATNDRIYLYVNDSSGEFWFDDTTKVGFDPYAYYDLWHGIVAMDTARNYLWHQTIKDAVSGSGNSGFAIDNNNDIYFGNSIGQPNTTMLWDSIPLTKAMYILKMNAQGDVIRIIEPSQFGPNTRVYDLSFAVDNFNNLYVAGTFEGDSISFGGLPPIVANNDVKGFIIKFDANSNALWQLEINGYFYPSDLIVTPNNNLYMAGTHNQDRELNIGNFTLPVVDSFQNYANQFIAKISENGVPLLLKNILNFADSTNYSAQVQMEKASDGYVLASTFKKANFGDGIVHTRAEKSLFLAKYNLNDSLIWLKLTPPLTGTNAFSSSLDINENGEIFWLHQLYGGGTWTMDGVPAYSHNMMQFDAQGQVMCIEPLGRFGIAANNSAVYTMVEHTVPFSSRLIVEKWEIGNCERIWQRDIAWGRFWGSTQKIDVSDNINLYPNPVLDAFSVELDVSKTGKMEYQIFNVTGQMVKNGQMISNHSLNVQELETGVYVLKIYFDGKLYAKKFVKL